MAVETTTPFTSCTFMTTSVRARETATGRAWEVELENAADLQDCILTEVARMRCFLFARCVTNALPADFSTPQPPMRI